MSIRIVLADDHALMRSGLASLLRNEPDLQVVGEAEGGHQVIDLAEKLLPDVVILDIEMAGLNGIDAARTIHSRLPKVRIVALTMHAEHRFVVGMLQAGVLGYLPKSCAFEELAEAIRYVHSGVMYLSPCVTGAIVKDFLNHIETDGHYSAPVLSGREREVLQLVAEGNCSKEIAATLHVSVNTVIRHRQHIMDKLDMHGVAELTRYAITEGMISLKS